MKHNRFMIPWALCLALCFSLITPASAEVSVLADRGYIITSGPEELAPLREGPSDDAGVIASYFSGTRYELDGTPVIENGYVHIFITFKGAFAEGYMRQDSLKTPDSYDEYGRLIIEPYALEAATIRVPEGEEGAPLHDGMEGMLYDGTQVVLLGIGDGFYHIRIGGVESFIDEQYIDRTGEPPSQQTEIPSRGYAVIREDAYTAGATATALPSSLNTQAMPYTGIPFCATLHLYSASEQDAQTSYGFLPLNAVSLYWVEDLYVSADPIGEGIYTAGQDFPSGLYTFLIAQGQSGSIQTDINGVQREYAAKGEAEYTLYLPEGMRVSCAGGTLRPKTAEPYFGIGKASTFTGSGRRFIDPENVGSTFYLAALPGAKNASYTIASLLYEEGLAEPRLTGELAPGEQTGFQLYPGEFIHIENCTLEAAFGNG